MPSRVSIVIPCFNEAQRLPVKRLLDFQRARPWLRWIMVNDGSRDTTLDLLQDMRRHRPAHVHVVDLTDNGGKAEAVRQGIQVAWQDQPDYVGYWDADLAAPMDGIQQFTELLDSRPDIDVVIGARIPMLGRNIQRHWLRGMVGTASAALASWALGQTFRDTQCGAKLFRVTPVTRQAFSEAWQSRWLFDVELFARLICSWNRPGEPCFAERVYEYPLSEWQEVPGSSLTIRDYFRAAADLCQIRWRYARGLAGPGDGNLRPMQPEFVPLNEPRAGKHAA